MALRFAFKILAASSCAAAASTGPCGPTDGSCATARLGVSISAGEDAAIELLQRKVSAQLPKGIPEGVHRYLGPGGDGNTSFRSPGALQMTDMIDVNGRFCLMCTMPLPERSDREYVSRTDCGNQTSEEHPENVFKPLIDFSRPASEGHNATTAWCELNTQKMCADALYNKDFLFQAKAISYPPTQTWDLMYCYHNGWLAPEFVRLQLDFEGMRSKATQVCNLDKYSKFHWNTTMNLVQMAAAYVPGMARGFPTEEEALTVGAWTCAMGSAGCDIAYCAYSFCVLGEHEDGTVNIGRYSQCEGWDPVKGMPMPKVLI